MCVAISLCHFLPMHNLDDNTQKVFREKIGQEKDEQYDYRRHLSAESSLAHPVSQIKLALTAVKVLLRCPETATQKIVPSNSINLVTHEGTFSNRQVFSIACFFTMDNKVEEKIEELHFFLQTETS